MLFIWLKNQNKILHQRLSTRVYINKHNGLKKLINFEFDFKLKKKC